MQDTTFSLKFTVTGKQECVSDMSQCIKMGMKVPICKGKPTSHPFSQIGQLPFEEVDISVCQIHKTQDHTGCNLISSRLKYWTCAKHSVNMSSSREPRGRGMFFVGALLRKWSDYRCEDLSLKM